MTDGCADLIALSGTEYGQQVHSTGPSTCLAGQGAEVEGTDRTPEQLGGFWRHCDLCLVVLVSERPPVSGRAGGPDGATVGRWAVAKA